MTIGKFINFQGIVLLEELVKKHSEGNRDYIYYLAIGNARLKQYSVALKFCNAFLQIEPNNQQAITLEVSVLLIFLVVSDSITVISNLSPGTHSQENG